MLECMFVLQLTYDDNPERLALRPAHRERMAALNAAGKVVAAGPWTDGSGALLVLRVDTIEQAQEIVDADPYYRAPGVTISGLREFDPVTRAPELG